MQIFLPNILCDNAFSGADSSDNGGGGGGKKHLSELGQEETGFSAVISVWNMDNAGIGLTDANWM